MISDNNNINPLISLTQEKPNGVLECLMETINEPLETTIERWNQDGSIVRYIQASQKVCKEYSKE